MDQKTLVTGANGFIGQRLMGQGVRGMVRREVDHSNSFVRGDLLDKSSLRIACKNIETIYHCAGYAHAFSSSDPLAHWRINTEGTQNLLEAAGLEGVKRFIFLSSVKAMAEPGNECADETSSGLPSSPYGKAKRAAEISVLEAGARYNMHVVNLRLAMVYGKGGKGNLERMAQGIKTGWFPPLPETGNRRSLVHVKDVVEAIQWVANRPDANGKTYIVANKITYSGREIYDAIAQALSLPKSKVCIYPSVFRAGGLVGDMLGNLLGRPALINSEVVSRLLDSACYSPEYIKRDLGWTARVSLEQGLKEMLFDETLN